MRLLFFARKLIPPLFFRILQVPYHYTLAFLGALFYRFPSRKLFVIGVTGTKGKTTVTELINALLENGGRCTALSNTLRFKIGTTSKRNMEKMTMPGRFFLQKFLMEALRENVAYVVIEMTSEGAKQFRHTWISLNALVFTNLSPEHIESHGSYEKYRDAKLKIARALLSSTKKEKFIVANQDDAEGKKFLDIRIPKKYPFSLNDVKPYRFEKDGVYFTFNGAPLFSPLLGEFNLCNILAALAVATALGVPLSSIQKTLEKFSGVPGRLEEITVGSFDETQSKPFDAAQGRQPFRVIVDYAHTPDSLKKVYELFKDTRKICVLGGTGGGRDSWKRKEMGSLAETYCEHIILTNEDPYDEKPEQIINDICSGFSKFEIRNSKFEIIMDRRKAIRRALELANKNDIVLITGKGTDPYIMGPSGTKTPWDDREVAREELKKLLFKSA